MKLSSHTEIPYIHLIRVVACFLVVTLHSIHQASFYSPTTLTAKLFNIFVGDITMACVPLFFMITGILIPIKDSDNISSKPNGNFQVYYEKNIL